MDKLIKEFIENSVDLRVAIKEQNYASIPGFIENLQSLANQVESGLENKKDLREIAELTSKARKSLKSLNAEHDKMKEQVKKLQKKKAKLSK